MINTEVQIETIIVGTRWRGEAALSALARMKPGDAIRLEREVGNRHDYAAIACHFHGLHVGFIPRQVNAPIAQAMDAGAIATAVVEVAARITNAGFIVKEPKIRVTVGGEPQL